jgi:hypothetical protein
MIDKNIKGSPLTKGNWGGIFTVAHEWKHCLLEYFFYNFAQALKSFYKAY